MGGDTLNSPQVATGHVKAEATSTFLTQSHISLRLTI